MKSLLKYPNHSDYVAFVQPNIFVVDIEKLVSSMFSDSKAQQGRARTNGFNYPSLLSAVYIMFWAKASYLCGHLSALALLELFSLLWTFQLMHLVCEQPSFGVVIPRFWITFSWPNFYFHHSVKVGLQKSGVWSQRYSWVFHKCPKSHTVKEA